MQDNQYDIAIIGGGPAGLQAALMLARTRKKIIVFDDPQPPRNGASHGVHNLLGLDGLRPTEIREIAWQQIAIYQSAELCHEQVTDVKKGDNQEFILTGDKGTSIKAKHLILAFGYRDVYPTIEGFMDCWADTIIQCPFCDGYENRDRVWGIVASSDREAHHFPTMLKNWTSDIKLLLQPNVSIDSDYHDKLIASGVSVHSGAISQIHHRGGKVEAVSLDNGEKIEVGTLLWIPPKKPIQLIQRLVENLGLEVDSEGFVKTNEMQATNIPQLWAAGDVQNGRSALDAVYTGSRVAQMIIKDWYQ